MAKFMRRSAAAPALKERVSDPRKVVRYRVPNDARGDVAEQLDVRIPSNHYVWHGSELEMYEPSAQLLHFLRMKGCERGVNVQTRRRRYVV